VNILFYLQGEALKLNSIRSAKNHDHLVEEIRKRAVTLNKKYWKI
jgi:hypothetical protein